MLIWIITFTLLTPFCNSGRIGGGFHSSSGGRYGGQHSYTSHTTSHSSSRPQPTQYGHSNPQTSHSSHPSWQITRPTSAPSHTNYGWQTQNKPTAAPQKNKPYPTQAPNIANHPTNHYGWQTPQNKPTVAPQTHTTQVPKNYGWQTPPSKQNLPNPTQAPKTYGWQSPPTKQNLPYPTQAPKTYGWQTPPTKQNLPHPTQAPAFPRPVTTSYGWKNPVSNTQKPVYPTQSPKISNQVQNNPYNTGKKYEKGFSKGYDEGYQRGVQQNSKIHPSYYPQQSHYGYPGQGINVGFGSPTYQGASMFGTPNNYGYSVNNAYGYQTYGTGNHDLRNGLLVGAIGGYLLHSALTPSHTSSSIFGHNRPSDSWGYSGSGYGSNYHYSSVDKTTIINNNNYFNNDSPTTNKSDSSSVPDNWIQCVAFDPMSGSTLTNPNCTCSVTLATDSVSNSTFANHNCSTIWGTKIEKTPVSDSEPFEPIYVTDKDRNPIKIQEFNSIDEQRREVYKKLNKILNMGSFTI